MNTVTAGVIVSAVIFTAPPGKCGMTGAEAGRSAFDELTGTRFPEIVESARFSGPRIPAPVDGLAHAGEVSARTEPAAQREAEIKRCPPGAVALGGSPDPDLYTYVGFRYVRSDGTACEEQSGGGIYYQEPAEKDLVFTARPEENGQSSYNYELESREYVVRRNFFFRTQLDGSRLFYSHDARQYTGKQVPEAVKLEFVNRADYPLLPWESPETFRLRYGAASGAGLTPGKHTNYEYDVRASAGSTPEGNLSTRFDVRVIRKKSLTPPESGAVALAPVNGGNTLMLDVRDTRAKYYRKEKIGLRIRVWKNVPLWYDAVVYEMEMELDAAPQIRIDLSDPRWDRFRKEAVAAGREYYADWSFRRADSVISTGEWIDKGRTDRVTVGGSGFEMPR